MTKLYIKEQFDALVELGIDRPTAFLIAVMNYKLNLTVDLQGTFVL
jgi:hypothetical protein